MTSYFLPLGIGSEKFCIGHDVRVGVFVGEWGRDGRGVTEIGKKVERKGIILFLVSQTNIGLEMESIRNNGRILCCLVNHVCL